MIESAQIKIIKEAFRLRYRKNSKLISEYAGYVKNLCNADNQDEYIKYTAITLFPNDEAYNRRMARYRNWFQSKKELLTSIEDLYNLYYELSKKDQLMTETEIEEAIEDILIDK
ncbi:20716_t:CDS:1 [Gigaspora rosea]|nr:20716_t:CDS:1 [Gigaspora rosea]